MNNSTASVNLGVENEPWLAFDALRSNMDADEHKHVVLGLIFLKYISGYRNAQPINPIAERFYTLVKEVVDRIQASNAESRTLAVSCNALLSKLVSGDLRVRDTERVAGRVV